jgi:hypothetical protein
VTKTLFTLLLSCALATALVAQSPGRAHDYVRTAHRGLALSATIGNLTAEAALARSKARAGGQ